MHRKSEREKKSKKTTGDTKRLCRRKNYTEVLDTSDENSLILRYSIPVNPDYKDLLLL